MAPLAKARTPASKVGLFLLLLVITLQLCLFATYYHFSLLVPAFRNERNGDELQWLDEDPSLLLKRGEEPRDAIIYLTNEQRAAVSHRTGNCVGLMDSLESLSFHFPNARSSERPGDGSSLSYPPPVVWILHDTPLSNTTRSAIEAASPFPVMYHEIPFVFPEEERPMNPLIRTSNDEKWMRIHDKINYKRMIAFWFLHIFELDFLPDYVMRLDTDSCLQSDIPMNPFQFMREQKVDYMWHSTRPEREYVILELKEFVEKNLVGNKTIKRGGRMFDPTTLWRKTSVDVFYNNIEWMHLPAFRTKEILQWKELVKLNGGIYRNRWGDAPLRTIEVATFFNATQVARFCNFRYKHRYSFAECRGRNGKRYTDSFGWKVV